jgi:hypothetical protein
MKLIKIKTAAIEFELFQKEASSDLFILFLQGLHEPTSGLYYTFKEMGLYLHEKLNANILHFDLSGCGNSLYPLDFNLWQIQLDAIKKHFFDKKLYFVARGISAYLLEKIDEAILIEPASKDIFSACIEDVVWQASPFDANLITPQLPLNEKGMMFFHNLGAESECIGGLEVTEKFLKDIEEKIKKSVFENKSVIKARGHHLFDKLSERVLLNQKVSELLIKKVKHARHLACLTEST